ncbi:TPA: hypothetical protein ACH3X2_009178 [Trebouxia sp. C0005]
MQPHVITLFEDTNCTVDSGTSQAFFVHKYGHECGTLGWNPRTGDICYRPRLCVAALDRCATAVAQTLAAHASDHQATLKTLLCAFDLYRQRSHPPEQPTYTLPDR